jgi:hypothetical protein
VTGNVSTAVLVPDFTLDPSHWAKTKSKKLGALADQGQHATALRHSAPHESANDALDHTTPKENPAGSG